MPGLLGSALQNMPSVRLRHGSAQFAADLDVRSSQT